MAEREVLPAPLPSSVIRLIPLNGPSRADLVGDGLAWLDDCARDTRIRIATVPRQGGLGKTSVVGHWIEKHHGWQHRAFRGVFFYSFYSEEFFAAFLKFVCEVGKVRPPNNDSSAPTPQIDLRMHL
jgi:hypothetical protein